MVVFGVVVAGLAVPTAAADKPVKEPLPASDLTGQFCEDFQVHVRVTMNKEVIHVFSDGVSMITGAFKVEATNISSGKTLALNISGPGKISPDGSTLSAHGRWLLFGEAGQLPGADPGMLLVSGRTQLTVGPSGIVAMSTTGHVEDVCAALAA